MILWNAFNDYFLRKGNTPKLIMLGILAGLFLLHRFGVIERCKAIITKVPSRQWLFLVLILGFTLRIAWVAWSPYSPPAAGTEDYIMIRHGHELATGKGYITTEGEPSADRPIGYALFLAGIFKIFGENLDVVALINIFFSLVTVWLIYRLGVAIKNEFVGVAAAFLLAIYPTAIFACRIVLEEHVFIPMWLGGIWLLISDYQKSDWIKVLGAALLFAVAAHFRTFSFAMGLVVFFMWFFCKKSYGQAFLRFFLIQALILLFALPWAIRNEQKMGEPILYTTWIGASLYYSNNSTSDVRYPINPTVAQGGDLAYSLSKNEVERNRTGKAAALRWIKAHPSMFIQKALGRVIYMLGLTREGWIVKDNFNSIRSGRTRPADKVIGKLDRMDNDFYGVIFLLALFGLIVFICAKKRYGSKPGAGYLLVSVAYYLFIIGLTLGHRKYRFSLEPVFCILAAYGIAFFTAPLNRIEKKPAHG